MIIPGYLAAGSVLSKGSADERGVRELQTHLRMLGYLKSGIDGRFGNGTELAVKALQYDLLNNDGQGTDDAAPVAVRSYNKERVVSVTGAVEQSLAACIADMLNDPRFQVLPKATDPAAENKKVRDFISGMDALPVPVPFLMAILMQESELKHFHESSSGDEDTFITVGLDRRGGGIAVTSRGYGAGQYTLFHHPPRPEEIKEFMLDPLKNVSKAVNELREKFEKFVDGTTPGTQADDRIAEAGRGPLRACVYSAGDARYMKDCKVCVQKAGVKPVRTGDPVYEGSALTMRSTNYHPEEGYAMAPVRRNIKCDWPYAVRRYNGSGVDSYHYQIQVLSRLLE